MYPYLWHPSKTVVLPAPMLFPIPLSSSPPPPLLSSFPALWLSLSPPCHCHPPCLGLGLGLGAYHHLLLLLLLSLVFICCCSCHHGPHCPAWLPSLCCSHHPACTLGCPASPLLLLVLLVVLPHCHSPPGPGLPPLLVLPSPLSHSCCLGSHGLCLHLHAAGSHHTGLPPWCWWCLIDVVVGVGCLERWCSWWRWQRGGGGGAYLEWMAPLPPQSLVWCSN